MKKDFNEYRFSGLDYKSASNQYYTMKRVNADESKVVVKVADCHLRKTKFGYALILNAEYVVFIKDWQVDMNYFGNEVLLTEEYFQPKKWGDWSDDFDDDVENLSWSTWVKLANEQDDLTDEEGCHLNQVRWSK